VCVCLSLVWIFVLAVVSSNASLLGNSGSRLPFLRTGMVRTGTALG
jgi:hypothetical protein